MKTLTLRIDGMSCGHCVRAVEASLQQFPDVKVHKVSVGNASVTVEETQLAQVVSAIEDAGYAVRPA